MTALHIAAIDEALAEQAAGAAPPPDASRVQPAQAFPVLEYRVAGNTLLPVIEIERAVMPFLGEGQTIATIESARKSLEQAYQAHGYRTVQVNIPQQRIAGGVVGLQVTEAPVGSLRITGSRYHSLDHLRDTLSELREGNVPQFTTVQSELADANRSPDLRVTPLLKASSTPGEFDVELQVKDTLPLHAELQVDNRYSANTTRLRATAELRYDNLFQRGQSLNLQYQTAPQRLDDARVWSVSYVLPTGSNSTWAAYFIHSGNDIAAVGDLSVIGKGDIFGVRRIQLLPSARPTFYHSFSAGFDYKRFQQAVTLGEGGRIDSPVRYPPVSLQYSATWLGPSAAEGARRGANPNGRSNTTLSLGASFLIRGLATDWREFADKRAYAGPSYLIIRPGVSREQVLPAGWSVVARFDAQLASGPLINNEEYSAGGAESVRGYTESERLGDNGARVSLELRTPQLLSSRVEWVQQSYALLFVDAARLHVLQALPGQDTDFSLASAGLGVRFKAGGVSATLDGARILREGAVTPAGRYRGLFRLNYSY